VAHAGPATHADPATHAGLPRRTRQASLSPHLRDRRPPGAVGHPPGTGPLTAPPVARTPERARDLAASVQNAWQRSREAGPPDDVAISDVPISDVPATEIPATEIPAAERDQPETPGPEEEAR
jgi:hypothetical protein